MLKTDPCAVFSLAGRGNQAAVSGLAEVETTIESMQFRIHQWPVDTEALAQRGELQQRTLMQHTQAGALPLSTSIAPVAPLSITARFAKSKSKGAARRFLPVLVAISAQPRRSASSHDSSPLRGPAPTRVL